MAPMQYRRTTVRMEIEAVIDIEQPVERSAETQVADFVLPALDDLKENNPQVQSIKWSFTES